MTAPACVTLLQPPRIRFGPGCATDCVDLLADRGTHRVLLVTTTRGLAQAAPLREALGARGIASLPSPAVPSEPTIAAFERIRAELHGERFDAVIGFGGGSALDVAKLLAALVSREEPVSAFFGIDRLPPGRLPLVCLPTTAGTGSEVSPNAILLDETARLKQGVISPHLVPDAAYVDPLLTLSAPPALTAATGLDALVHCIEAYANRCAHPLVDVHALEGVRLLGAHLPTAVRRGDDQTARTAVARGSLHGGLCLGPVNTAAVHALSYPLSSAFHVPHGLANAVLLPHVLRFNLPAAPARYAAIARALGVPPGADDLATATAGVDRLEALAQECGLPPGLPGHAVTPADLPGLVAGALQVSRLLRHNPRELTAADAAAIYRAALFSA